MVRRHLEKHLPDGSVNRLRMLRARMWMDLTGGRELLRQSGEGQQARATYEQVRNARI